MSCPGMTRSLYGRWSLLFDLRRGLHIYAPWAVICKIIHCYQLAVNIALIRSALWEDAVSPYCVWIRNIHCKLAQYRGFWCPGPFVVKTYAAIALMFRDDRVSLSSIWKYFSSMRHFSVEKRWQVQIYHVFTKSIQQDKGRCNTLIENAVCARTTS